MTEIARRDEQTQAVARVEDVPATALGRWAYDARQAAAVAQSLARTPFVPQSLREKPTSRDAADIEQAHQVTVGNVTAAILTGIELGLEPMAALRSIDVIQGTPATRAITVRAVVLARGHDMWVVESNETRCVIRGRRQGSDQVQESNWNIDRARKLGLLGKDNWKRQPQAMLVARATSELGRLIAPDALLGIPYSVEELDDGADGVAPGPDAAPAAEQSAPAKRTAQRRTRGQSQAVARPPVATEAPPAEAPEPDFDETEPAPKAESTPTKPAEPATEPDVPMISDKQLQKLHVVYTELGIKDRDQRLTDVTEFLGRDLESSKDLTRDEATRLIDDLERRVSGMKPGKPEADDEFCTVCGANETQGEPHDDEVHEAAGV